MPRSRSRAILWGIVTFGYAMVTLGMAFFMHQAGLPEMRAGASFAALVVVFSLRVYMGGVQERHPSDRISWRDWFVFALPPLLMVRLLGIVDEGVPPEYADWVSSLFPLLLDMPMFILLLLMVATWTTGALLGEQIDALHAQTAEGRGGPDITGEGRAGWERQGRAMAMVWLNRVAAGGAVILIVLAALLVAIPRYVDVGEAVPTGVVLVVILLYFVSLLVLHSYASLVRRQTNWTLDGVPQTPGIATNWLRATMLVLGVALLVVVFLPRFEAPDIGAGVSPLVGMAQFVFGLLVAPFVLIIFLLGKFFSLFGRGGENGGEAAVRPDLSVLQGSGNDDLMAFLQSAFLWVVLGLAAYLIVRRLQTRRGGLAGIGAAWRWLAGMARWPRMLAEILRGFFAVAGETVAEAAVATRAGLARLRGVSVGLGSAREAAPVTNRERVWRAYRGVLEAADAAGHPRQGAQTAEEFRQSLEPHLATDRESLRTVTEVFVRARYSRTDPEAAGVERAQASAARVEARLRGTAALEPV
ncbi:MAG: DUF4129 domain-containing protein [Chloroflexota bacterium]|nr:DUF4129 domain-containing protein [Chloroflexota bacterium]